MPLRMRFRNLFVGGKPAVAWTYSTRGLIWRVLPSADGVLAGEERNPETREASFFCLRSDDGGALWEHTPFGDGWWMASAGLTRGVLLLHGYATPDLPIPMKIFAIDVRTGKLLWQNDKLAFAGVKGNAVLGSTGGAPDADLMMLDLRTGDVLSDAGQPTTGEENAVLFPALVTDPDAVVSRLCPKENLAGPVEILEVGDAVVVHWFERSQASSSDKPGLRSELRILHRQDGRVVYRDCLLASTHAPTPDVFFEMRGYIYYIREHRNIVAVRLPPHPPAGA
jgi:hypothetical protein